MHEREKLMQRARMRRTRAEHLQVINRRLDAVDSAILSVQNQLSNLVDAFKTLQDDVAYYRATWEDDPTAPPLIKER